MSNKQLLTSYYSVVNNTSYNYSNTQVNNSNHRIQLPFSNTVSIELRNNKPKQLAHRSFNDNNFIPTNSKLIPYKQDPIILKENEIQEINSWDLAEIYAKKSEDRLTRKREILSYKEEIVKDDIKKRIENKLVEEEKEKLKLEEDLINIISKAMKFTKKNNPMVAMMGSNFNKDILKMSKERSKIKKASSSKVNNLNISLNKSLGSLINISSLSTSSVTKYNSSRFLQALGIDLNNFSQENININIDMAMEQISKWRLVDKSKLRNLIRMRVINEISSIEERRSVQKLQKLKNKIEKFKEFNKQSKKKESKTKKNQTQTINNDISNLNEISGLNTNSNYPINISSVEKEISKEYVSNRLMKSKLDKTIFSKTIDQNQKSTMMKTTLNESSKNKSKILFDKKSANIYFEKKKKPNVVKRKKKLLDGYNDTDKLIKICYSNPKLKENKKLVNHFKSLNDFKKMDNLIDQVVYRNKIVLTSESKRSLS